MFGVYRAFHGIAAAFGGLRADNLEAISKTRRSWPVDKNSAKIELRHGVDAE
jgi:hypothetical protein